MMILKTNDEMMVYSVEQRAKKKLKKIENFSLIAVEKAL